MDFGDLNIKATSKNVIPAKAGIQKLLTSLDSRLRGSDKLIIIRSSLNFIGECGVIPKKVGLSDCRMWIAECGLNKIQGYTFGVNLK